MSHLKPSFELHERPSNPDSMDGRMNYTSSNWNQFDAGMPLAADDLQGNRIGYGFFLLADGRAVTDILRATHRNFLFACTAIATKSF